VAPSITQSFIPKGKRNRPGYKLTPKKITIHDTANPDKGADAEAHVGYFKGAVAAAIPSSVHFVVDGGVDGKKAPAIYQLLPLDENGWHAGDGTNGPGNRTSIAIEICENKDGNRAVAEANAAWLTAKLLKDYGLQISDVKQHYDWSGKNCPNVLRGRKNGWDGFLAAVESYLKSATPIPSGILYRVQIGAYTIKGNAEATLKKAQAAGFKDAYIVTERTTSADSGPAPTPTPTPTPTLKVGSRVKVKSGAKDYNGVQLASFVFNRTYNVIQITNDRVVIGEGKVVTAAVKLKDLALV